MTDNSRKAFLCGQKRTGFYMQRTHSYIQLKCVEKREYGRDIEGAGLEKDI